MIEKNIKKVCRIFGGNKKYIYNKLHFDINVDFTPNNYKSEKFVMK